MKKDLRIAIGGIRHETNTFSHVWTEYEDFRVMRGSEILERGLGLTKDVEGVDLLPIFVAYAQPGGMARKSVYLRLKEELLSELKKVLPVDGVYLDLHGAMEVEEIGDGDGDLASTVRELVGPDTLITAYREGPY